MSVQTELYRLVNALRRQGPRMAALAGLDKIARWTTGVPLTRFSRYADGVILGGQPGRRGRDRLIAQGVTGFVNLRSEFDYAEAVTLDGVRYLHLPTDDETAPTLDHLHAGVAFMRDEIARGGRVYVHCWEGLGRGPTMLAAFFVAQGDTPDEAWARVLAVRPFVRPTRVQRDRLIAFAQATTP